MDPVLLARLQFAMTVGFHYIYPPITIGMAWIIFWFMDRYRKTGDDSYGLQARFWTKLFAITFVVGVATGITLEFQFGTNWADYARFVGDVFGPPLAAEGIMAFFLESTFMGVLLFGWKRFSNRTLWTASLLVAIGATLSAFWIIVANSWMQTPAGYEIVDGRAQLTDFWAAVFNPSTLPRYAHSIVGCFVAGAFFMMSVSAWYLWKERHAAFARRALVVSLVVGFVSSVAQGPVGHWHAVQVTETQPAKMAAYEGLFDTTTRAPYILFGFPDPENARVNSAVKVPAGLSMLVGFDPDTEVKGLNDFPRDLWPPVKLTFWSYHLMIVLGLYFMAVTALGLFLYWRKKLFNNKLFMKIAFFSVPLPVVANELGWMAAEVGRQPWIVYEVEGMKTAAAVSPVVSAGEILASMIMFGLVYTLLFFVWLYLLKRRVQEGPEPQFAAATSGEEVVS